jgi:hypothetical protein
MDEVRRASRDFEKYSQRLEGAAVLFPPKFEASEESWQVRDRRARAFLHPGKVSYELRHQLLETGQAQENDEWLEVNRDAASAYMTVLAANLAQNRGLALLADEQRFEPLADSVRRGEAEPAKPPDKRRMGEAMLAHLALETVNITPDTPMKEVLEFRRKYPDEVAHFRQVVGELANKLRDEAYSLEAFQQETQDLYINDVRPAINDLKAALNAVRIRCLVSSLKTLAFSTPLSLLPAAAMSSLLGQFAVPIALFAGAGVSITANLANFRLDKQELLRKNPYTYVLAAQRAFGIRSG